MSRGLGNIQRECLHVIAGYNIAGTKPTTFNVAADVYRVKRDSRGNRTISDAQHAAIKRALGGLRRKGLVAGKQDVSMAADGRKILARQSADGLHAERCCLWSIVAPLRKAR